MERKYFKKLVMAGFLKSLTLSFAGLVDCAVVGRYLGMDGLSALKLAMPVYSAFSFFSGIMGTGLSVMISRVLSEHGIPRATRVFRSTFTLILAIGTVITVFGAVAPELLGDLLTGQDCDPVIRKFTTDYLRPVLLCALPILLYDILGTIAMITGGTKYLRAASIALFAVDVIGDLLAVRFDWSMTGIALASAAAYASAFLIVLCFFFRKKTMFRLGICLPNADTLKNTLLMGIPVGITLICTIIRAFSINRFTLSFGSVPGLAALSVQDTIRYVPGALSYGISSATLILAGIYNAEADLYALAQEKKSLLRWSLIGGSSIAVVLMLLSWPLLWIFTDDPTIHSLGVTSLLLYLLGVPFLAMNNASCSMFQGLGKKGASIAFTVLHNLIAPIFFAWILGKRFGNIGIYASFMVGEVFTTVFLGLLVLIQKIRKKTLLTLIFMKVEREVDLRLNISDVDQAVSASRQVKMLCLEHGVDPKQAFLISLTTEELAMNSLEHGFDDHKEHHLELRFLITKDKLILRTRDDGRPFDLTQRYKMINPDDPTKNIGLRIIFASADEVHYNSSLSLNNVCVRINR